MLVPKYHGGEGHDIYTGERTTDVCDNKTQGAQVTVDQGSHDAHVWTYIQEM